MNRPTLLTYVNGHGFGHARRTACILAALRELRRDIRMVVRTNAPARIFGDVEISPSALDARVVEIDAWTIDAAATVEQVVDIFERRDPIIHNEVESIRALRPSMILADIPYLAGDVANALGVTCVASGNFTWDWIFEPMLARQPRGREILDAIGASYRWMTTALRHPFAHAMPLFGHVVDIPAVARQTSLDPRDTRRRLGMEHRRPCVLLAMRGGTPLKTLFAGAASAPDILFQTLQPLPIDPPKNLRQIEQGQTDFVDVMAAHDAVLSKLGYGIVCDALAAGTRLLWPRRSGFREDELFEREAADRPPMLEIDRDAYVSGRWRIAIETLLSFPTRIGARVDGAEVAARCLASML